MCVEPWVIFLVLALIGTFAIGGYFYKQKSGYGRFNTSTLLLLVVVVFSALLSAAGKLESNALANIFFAIVGFAGGLLTGKSSEKPPQGKTENTIPRGTAP